VRDIRESSTGQDAVRYWVSRWGSFQGLANTFIGCIPPCLLSVVALLLAAETALGAVKSWTHGSETSDSTYNFNAAGNWSASGIPANGDSAFITFNRGTGGGSGNTQIITNNATDVITTDSLTITNTSGGGKTTAFILLRGKTFFTNGVGALSLIGAAGNTTLNFSNDVTFKSASLIAAGGNATLTFAQNATGTATNRGANLAVTGGSGSAFLTIIAPMILSTNLTLTGGDANNVVLIRGNTTVGGSLTVAGSASATDYFVVTNSTLTVSNGVANSAGRIDIKGLGALNVARAWTNSGTINVAAGGLITGSTLTNQGTLTIIGVVNSLLVNQSRVDMAGTISNSLLQTAGSFTLSSSATITGAATISGGTVNLLGNRLTGSQFLVASGGALSNTLTGATISGGITNDGIVGFTSDVFVNGPVTNTGTWFQRGVISNDVVNSGTFSLFKNSINPLVTGNIINSGSLIFDNNNSPQVNGSITNSDSVAFNAIVDGNYVQTAGSTVINQSAGNPTVKGTARISGGTFDLAGKTYTNGLMVVSGTGVLTNGVAGAAFSGGLSNAASVVVTADTFFKGAITNTGAMFFRGAISNTVANAGSFTLVNNATLTGALANHPAGRVNVTNGTLRLLAAPSNTGTIDIAANNTLSITPAWANSGSLLIKGGFLVAGTTTNAAAGTIVGFGAISNGFVNLGSVTATNGTLNLAAAPVQNGTFNVVSSGALNVGAAWQNAGSVNLSGGVVQGAALTNAGTISGAGTITSTLVNTSGGTITASGGGTLTLTAAPLQNGTVNILGTLNVTSAWSNGSSGTVTLNGGTLAGGVFTVNGTVQGNGTISANFILGNGETITVNGGQLNTTGIGTMTGGTMDGGPLHNYGTITGFGTLSVAVSNPGYIRATNGLLYIQTLTGNQATGTLEASAGGTLQANGITSWLNDGRVILSGGTVIGGNISNNSGRLITGFGTINSTIQNSGTILATSASQALVFDNGLRNLAGGVVTSETARLVVSGAFTNAGTFTMMHGVGTFNGAVINSGAWITDPSTNIFNNTFTVTTSGFVSMSAGDVYIFTNNTSTTGHFVNLSTQSNSYDTLPGKFLFSATSGVTQDFYVAGHDLGPYAPGVPFASNALGVVTYPTVAGFSNNFALGTLEISDFTTVRVSDVFGNLGPGTNDNLTAGLYLGSLQMGLNSLLIISSNVQVYFLSSNNWSSANFVLEGNPTYDNSISGLHQLVTVPEPSVLMLLLLGGAAVVTRHNRRLRKD